MTRIGVTVPFEGLALVDHRTGIGRLQQAGFDGISTGEVDGADGITPLVLFGAWESRLVLTCAVTSVFTRGPALLAMTAAAFADAAPGRARFGIGSGSDRIVVGWNGGTFTRPYSRVASTLRFLRAVLRHGRAPAEIAEAVGSTGFQLRRIPAYPPSLILAALGPRTQRLAATEADGVVLTYLTPPDVYHIRHEWAAARRKVDTPLDTTVRLFVAPSSDSASELAARRHLVAYLTVPAYARYQTWLGRGEALAAMQRAWNAGNRSGAVRALPDAVVSDLVLDGSPKRCAERIRAFGAAGLDGVDLSVLTPYGAVPDPERDIELLVRIKAELHRHP